MIVRFGQQIFEYLFSSGGNAPRGSRRNVTKITKLRGFYSARLRGEVDARHFSGAEILSPLPELSSIRVYSRSATHTPEIRDGNVFSFEYIFLLCGAIRCTWCTSSIARREIFIRSSSHWILTRLTMRFSHETHARRTSMRNTPTYKIAHALINYKVMKWRVQH